MTPDLSPEAVEHIAKDVQRTDYPSDERAAVVSYAAALLRALSARLEEATKREAEYHDLISRLWSLVPSEFDQAKDVQDRVHAVLLGPNSSGECGNTVCAELRSLRTERNEAVTLLRELREWHRSEYQSNFSLDARVDALLADYAHSL